MLLNCIQWKNQYAKSANKYPPRHIAATDEFDDFAGMFKERVELYETKWEITFLFIKPIFYEVVVNYWSL